jgi:hypothetical protein
MDQHLGPNALEDEPHHQEFLRKCADELAASEASPNAAGAGSAGSDTAAPILPRRPARAGSPPASRFAGEFPRTLSPGTHCRHRLS